MKNIYFLCGLPRCGNTLLASILNQNPNISVTANSITADILYNLEQLKETTNFKNFPDYQSLDNLIKGSLELYFKDYKKIHYPKSKIYYFRKTFYRNIRFSC